MAIEIDFGRELGRVAFPDDITDEQAQSYVRENYQAIRQGLIGRRQEELAAETETEEKAKFQLGQYDTVETVLNTLSELPRGALEGLGLTLKAVARLPDVIPSAIPSGTYDPYTEAPIEQVPLFRAGQAVQEFGKETYPGLPGVRETAPAQVMGGIGSMVATLPAAVIAGPVGAAISYGLQSGESAFEEADTTINRRIAEAMASQQYDVAADLQDRREQMKTQAFITTAPIGAATEFFLGAAPKVARRFVTGRIGGIGERLAESLVPKSAKYQRKFLGVTGAERVRGAVEALATEFVQESAEQLGGNIAAAAVYDPERGWLDGVAQAGFVGSLSGGIVGGLVGSRRNAKLAGAANEALGGDPTNPLPRANATVAGLEDTQQEGEPEITAEDVMRTSQEAGLAGQEEEVIPASKPPPKSKAAPVTPEVDIVRLDDLRKKANTGTINPDELAELTLMHQTMGIPDPVVAATPSTPTTTPTPAAATVDAETGLRSDEQDELDQLITAEDAGLLSEDDALTLAAYRARLGGVKAVVTPVAPTPTPVATPVVRTPAPTPTPAPVVTTSAKLPKDLAEAKPRYSFSLDTYVPAFDSDFDLAAYIVTQAKPSLRDADYLNWAVETSGMTPEEVRKHGLQVRAQIKQLSRQTKGGTSQKPATLVVPSVRITMPEVRVTAKVTAKPTPKTGLSKIGEAGIAIGENLREALWDAFSTGQGPRLTLEDSVVKNARVVADKTGATIGKADFLNFAEEFSKAENPEEKINSMRRLASRVSIKPVSAPAPTPVPTPASTPAPKRAPAPVFRSPKLSAEDRKLIEDSKTDPSKIPAARSALNNWVKRVNDAQAKHEVKLRQWNENADAESAAVRSQIASEVAEVTAKFEATPAPAPTSTPQADPNEKLAAFIEDVDGAITNLESPAKLRAMVKKALAAGYITATDAAEIARVQKSMGSAEDTTDAFGEFSGYLNMELENRRKAPAAAPVTAPAAPVPAPATTTATKPISTAPATEPAPAQAREVKMPPAEKQGTEPLAPKAQKQFLLAQIDEAIAAAPEEATSEKILISVPGDGEFTLLNYKAGLMRFKDLAKQFPVSPLGGEPKTRTEAKQALRLGTLTLKNALKSGADMAADPVEREDSPLTAIFSDGKRIVASDGKTLLQIDMNAGGTTANPITVDETGKPKTFDTAYPNVDQVIPKTTTVVSKKINTERLFSVLTQAYQAAYDAASKNPDREANAVIVQNRDESIGLFSEVPGKTSYSHNVRKGAKVLTSYNIRRLTDLVQAMRRVGVAEFDLLVADEKDRSLRTDAGVLLAPGVKGLIMPIRMESYEVPRWASEPDTGRPDTVEAALQKVIAAIDKVSKGLSENSYSDPLFLTPLAKLALQIAKGLIQVGVAVDKAIRQAIAQARQQFPNDPTDDIQLADRLIRDAEYAAAVAAGDMDTAQRMVDEAAKAAGLVENGGFYVPDRGVAIQERLPGKTRLYRASDSGYAEDGQSFSEEISTANAYRDGAGFGGPNIFAYDVDTSKSLRVDGIKDFARKIDNIITDEVKEWINDRGSNNTLDSWKDYGFGYTHDPLHNKWGPKGFSLQEELRNKGYDWLVFEDEFPANAITHWLLKEVGLEGIPIKSADPITYDNAGNVISLSQRFQSSTADIRGAKPDRVEAILKKVIAATDPKGKVFEAIAGLSNFVVFQATKIALRIYQATKSWVSARNAGMDYIKSQVQLSNEAETAANFEEHIKAFPNQEIPTGTPERPQPPNPTERVESRGIFRGDVTRDTDENWQSEARKWVDFYKGNLEQAFQGFMGADIDKALREYVGGELLQRSELEVARAKNPIDLLRALNLQARIAAALVQAGSDFGKQGRARQLTFARYAWMVPQLVYRRLVNEQQKRKIPFPEIVAQQVREWLVESGQEAIDQVKEAMKQADNVFAREFKKIKQVPGQPGGPPIEIKWRDILTKSLQTQGSVRQKMLQVILADPKLRNLSPAGIAEITNLLTTAWENKRNQIFRAEFRKKIPLPTVKPDAREKLLRSLPRILKYANIARATPGDQITNDGPETFLLWDQAFRDAVAPEFGVAEINGLTARKLTELAQKAQAAQGTNRNEIIQQMFRLMAREGGVRFSDVLRDYWYAAVLSGIRTQVDNALNILNGALNTAMLAGLSGKEAGLVVKSALKGLNEGLRDFWPMLWRGELYRSVNFNPDQPGNALEGLGESRNLFAKGVSQFKYVSRLMLALDHVTAMMSDGAAKAYALQKEFTPEIARNLMLPDKALVQAARDRAIAEGTRPDLVNKRTREILQESFPVEILMTSKDIREAVTFTEVPQGVMGSLYEGLNAASRKFPALKFLTGTNFVRFAANYTNELLNYAAPIAAFRWYQSAPGRSDQPGGLQYSPARRDLLLAKATIGTALGATAAALFLGDDDKEEDRDIDITGSFKSLDPNKRKQLLAEGRQPYSIRVGDTYISYRQLGFGGLLGAIGELRDRQLFEPEKWNQESIIGKVQDAATAGLFIVKDSSAISGLTEFLGFANAYKYDTNEIVEKSAPRYLARLGGSFVPNILKEVDAWSDPSIFKAEPGGLGHEYFLQQVPFARREIGPGPILNVLGEPVRVERYPYSRWVTQRQDDPAWNTLGQLASRGVFMPTPAITVKVNDNGVRREMTREEKYQYQQAVGQGYRKFIEQNSKRLLALPPAEAADFIDKNSDRIRRNARTNLKNSF